MLCFVSFSVSILEALFEDLAPVFFSIVADEDDDFADGILVKQVFGCRPSRMASMTLVKLKHQSW